MHYRLFFFNVPATTEIYPLSLHDALPISVSWPTSTSSAPAAFSNRAATLTVSPTTVTQSTWRPGWRRRSEEHTSELQSRRDLVCRLLLEKKKNTKHRQRLISIYIRLTNL